MKQNALAREKKSKYSRKKYIRLDLRPRESMLHAKFTQLIRLHADLRVGRGDCADQKKNAKKGYFYRNKGINRH